MPMCAFMLGTGRGASLGRGSSCSFTSCAVLQLASRLVGWHGELVDGGVALGARAFPELPQAHCRGAINTTTRQQLWYVCHGFSFMDAEY